MFEAAQRAAAGDLPYFECTRRDELSFLVWGRDEDGRTLLHLAAANGHLQLIEILVNAGAGKVINKADDQAWTPLHAAVHGGHEKVVAMLLGLGAATDVFTGVGETPMHLAAAAGHVGIARTLLAAGARADARDHAGATSLHRAAARGHACVARVLLEEGRARVDAHDRSGATPLLLAVGHGHQEVAFYLVSQGANPSGANKAGQTPLQLAGDLAGALQAAAAACTVAPRRSSDTRRSLERKSCESHSSRLARSSMEF